MKNLQYEISDRELDKHQLFKEKILNIKLAKLSALNSSRDYYTFKDEFEKLHLRTTPKTMLPELLRNNYLENPALSLVKNTQNIDEVWKRLKKAYGDTKIMLSKKLTELENLAPIWKIKSPAKIAESLTKIISTIKDLIQLSYRHNTEHKLYNSDALDKIYKLMGDGRMTKWLSSIYDEDIEGEVLWKGLIVFLEKDFSNQQQKIIINEGNKSKDQKQQDRPQRNTHYSSKGSVKSSSSNGLKCHKRSKEDHVRTAGPGGIKLIQYFTCKQFIEMTPADRFQLLKKKCLCFQCLYPDVKLTDTKHSEGRCQTDYTCNHPSHDKFPTKKHVLVCAEHKNVKKTKRHLSCTNVSAS